MMIIWKEEKTYKGQENNTAFSVMIGKFTAHITCNHIYHRDNWIMHLYPGKLADTMPLGLSKNADIENVKSTAERMIYDLLFKQKQLIEDALFQLQTAVND
jgi:hypothetical protein